MKLKVYLATINMTVKDFGFLVNYNPTYLSQIVTGKKIPGKKLAKVIEDITDGQVKCLTKHDEQCADNVKCA